MTLVSPQPREWTHARWFQQILTDAANEYDVTLRLTRSTIWSDVSPELQRDIRTFDQSDWLSNMSSRQGDDDARYWRKLHLEQVLSRAARLWDQGRYADYVGTMEPLRDQLSPSQLMRLSIAERRAQT